MSANGMIVTFTFYSKRLDTPLEDKIYLYFVIDCLITYIFYLNAS